LRRIHFTLSGLTTSDAVAARRLRVAVGQLRAWSFVKCFEQGVDRSRDGVIARHDQRRYGQGDSLVARPRRPPRAEIRQLCAEPVDPYPAVLPQFPIGTPLAPTNDCGYQDAVDVVEGVFCRLKSEAADRVVHEIDLVVDIGTKPFDERLTEQTA